MSRARRAACCVALGEIEGGRFDWSALSWLT
ncbi:hypothetical protein FHR90_002841 [Endobacter medicaginis]|uniref:Uncharacterized protein n=1 Tax=Endobacter medicaginis TaxID=1181271 RepID=A0A839V3D8_9PROT|nr:hypothetical protein [Endobacter medicaginis]